MEVVAGGDKTILTRMGESHAERELTDIYSFFLKRGSPQFIISKAPRLFRTFFDFGEATVKLISQRNAVLTLKGFENHHWPLEFVSLGWCKKALQLSGAKNMQIKLAKSLRDGKGYFEIHTIWSDEKDS